MAFVNCAGNLCRSRRAFSMLHLLLAFAFAFGGAFASCLHLDLRALLEWRIRSSCKDRLAALELVQVMWDVVD